MWVSPRPFFEDEWWEGVSLGVCIYIFFFLLYWREGNNGKA